MGIYSWQNTSITITSNNIAHKNPVPRIPPQYIYKYTTKLPYDHSEKPQSTVVLHCTTVVQCTTHCAVTVLGIQLQRFRKRCRVCQSVAAWRGAKSGITACTIMATGRTADIRGARARTPMGESSSTFRTVSQYNINTRYRLVLRLGSPIST
jgi:hypothetical protein